MPLFGWLALAAACSGGLGEPDISAGGGEGGSAPAFPQAGQGADDGAAGTGGDGNSGNGQSGGAGNGAFAGSTHGGAEDGGAGDGGASGAASGGMGGWAAAGAAGGADACSSAGAREQTEMDELENAGFELGLQGWTVSGAAAAAYVESLNAHGGSRNLGIRSSSAYEVAVEQTLCELPAGSYTLRAWLKSSTDIGSSQLFFRSAEGEQTVSIPEGLSSALRITFEPLSITACPCTIGVRAAGPGGSWLSLDDVELFPGSPTFDPEYLLGGDITFRRQLADLGTVFYDRAGNEADVLDTLAEHGFNFVRIRIYNQPGHPNHFPSNQFAAGYQDAADARLSAREAADRGMSTVISFHYSDYWTNPDTQYKPFEWQAMTAEQLVQAVYDYTYQTMAAFAAQGTPPAIVALGNETNAGMIWPEGRIGYQGENFAEFAALFNAGSRAVRAVFPNAKIAIHLSKPEARPEIWIGWARAAGLEYDTIGLSLYPFWSGLRVRDMKNVVRRLIESTGKDVVALESGYPWSLTRPSGYPTMIASNSLNPQGLETFGVSPAGQELYMRSFFQQLHEVPGFLGAIYWDPIWIDTPPLPSNVGDTALFDWEGRPLPALDAFHEKFR